MDVKNNEPTSIHTILPLLSPWWEGGASDVSSTLCEALDERINFSKSLSV